MAYPSSLAAENDLPSTYDSRDLGKAPVIKSQGKLGTCWAITASSALEAYFLPVQHFIFSADHISLGNSFVIDQSEGGDYRMLMAYLSGWQGPVLEEEDPYGDGETPEGLEAAVHVKEMRILEGADRDTFKEMIRDYGSVQSSLYMNRRTTSQALAFYNGETAGYYYTESKTPDHDILLLGWDDAYPRENFKTVPEGDGAWLCQNTWGEDFGIGGMFYVSYYDANLAHSGIVYTRAEEALPDERIYQTDECGWQGKIGYGEPDCYFANIFVAGESEEKSENSVSREESSESASGEERDGSDDQAAALSAPTDPGVNASGEYLTGIGFYATTAHTVYELYLVRDFTGTESFMRKQTIGRGEIDGIGFFSAALDEPILLEAGERFAVAVNIHAEDAEKPVAVELNKDRFTRNVTTEGKEGYISLYGGEWENVEEKYGANVCLKAYTRTAERVEE